MSRSAYILAGGGTGGHLYPGLAVAEEIRRARPDSTIVFACSDREIDRRILEPTGYAMVPQSVRALPHRPGQALPFLAGWLASNRLAKRLIDDLRPAAVLGLGGFAAAPAVRQGARRGLRTAMLNPDAVPGKANRFLGRYVQAVFTQFDQTRKAFSPHHRSRVQCVGCPTRRSLLGADRVEAMSAFNLDGDKQTLLVFGGSLMASSINEAMALLASELSAVAGRWQVLHVAGKDHKDELSRAYAAEGVPAATVAYCDRMDLAYAAADLVLCRGGASTIAELAATGTPAVIMPYPHHRDRQQELNARAFVAGGGGVCLGDAVDAAANAASLTDVLLPLMRDADRLERMRRAAAEGGRANAAQRVAEWLCAESAAG